MAIISKKVTELKTGDFLCNLGKVLQIETIIINKSQTLIFVHLNLSFCSTLNVARFVYDASTIIYIQSV